jgi:hypothetical protein
MTTTSTLDLVKIIKACRLAGVSKFKSGDTEIDFLRTSPQETKTADLAQLEFPAINKEVLHTDTQNTIGAGEEELKKIDEEIEEANLVLEDPLAWERAELSGGKA